MCDSRHGLLYGYGTAGFRLKAHLLTSVVFRVGLLAAVRLKKLNGQTIGVMITASHNPAEDNGVKLVDPQGEMLEGSWEAYATLLANAQTDNELVVTTTKTDMGVKANVIFAKDTRSSGPSFVAALQAGLTAMSSEYKDYDILTTSHLHYLVRCINTAGTPAEYGAPTEPGYYKKLGKAFRTLMDGKTRLSPVFVDCANGVGAPKLRELSRVVGKDILDVQIVNSDIENPSKLNSQCASPQDRCASFDGDTDRVVYYYLDQDSTFHLLDGDKIASLATMFIQDLVKSAGLEEEIKVGVVQTAYANGASTVYLQKVFGVPVTFTHTGVKHLHHTAQRYDVGVYFEANGHGTVLFSPATLSIIEAAKPQSPAQHTALQSLRALSELINQTVGDALSDLLMVEAILAHKGWGPMEWDDAYTDLPNRLVRVVVKDRHAFSTTDAERRLVSPAGIQDRINALVAKYKGGRAFVRASGTEDAVRVYAEAGTRSEADEFACKVAGLLTDY
ncbi:Phosphoacetylglucosamine mutase [Saitoella complicata NRRL Y-17804]|uniref:Phosphoacetylglucosamine mutase n=1 Tax=Saitoella complicata (strain BCRC 22490 / CBS 7301 / JCM 7358 / NBRC 10748 / NRRL Y-17804) TaxID=698492 RepID=UPI000867A1FD|nr:Phosphoacetylglucosamine mutase [Saitoella complicata NRRL Y-17804]ODQ51585.1 Phosphoacetylglucosamine mutase [Saitoella complicata NRRL Y-17804]